MRTKTPQMPPLPIQKTATIGDMLEWAKSSKGLKTKAEKKIRILQECEEKWGPMCSDSWRALAEPWRLRETVEQAYKHSGQLPHRSILDIRDIGVKKIPSHLVLLVTGFVEARGLQLHFVGDNYFTMNQNYRLP